MTKYFKTLKSVFQKTVLLLLCGFSQKIQANDEEFFKDLTTYFAPEKEKAKRKPGVLEEPAPKPFMSSLQRNGSEQLNEYLERFIKILVKTFGLEEDTSSFLLPIADSSIGKEPNKNNVLNVLIILYKNELFNDLQKAVKRNIQEPTKKAFEDAITKLQPSTTNARDSWIDWLMSGMTLPFSEYSLLQYDPDNDYCKKIKPYLSIREQLKDINMPTEKNQSNIFIPKENRGFRTELATSFRDPQLFETAKKMADALLCSLMWAAYMQAKTIAQGITASLSTDEETFVERKKKLQELFKSELEKIESKLKKKESKLEKIESELAKKEKELAEKKGNGSNAKLEISNLEKAKTKLEEKIRNKIIAKNDFIQASKYQTNTVEVSLSPVDWRDRDKLTQACYVGKYPVAIGALIWIGTKIVKNILNISIVKKYFEDKKNNKAKLSKKNSQETTS